MAVNACFVIYARNISKVPNTILSRCSLMNLAFPINNIYNTLNRLLDTHSQVNKDTFESEYASTGYDILSYIMKYSLSITTTCLDEVVIKHFDNVIKEKNILNVIMTTRELSYKLYHINFPISMLSHIIINKHKDKDNINDIVSTCADCDALAATSKKDVLVYEKMLLQLYHLIKKSKVAKLPPTLKKIVKKSKASST